jgi:hypothetical protein
MRYTSKDHYMVDSLKERRETAEMKQIPEYQKEKET